MQDTITASIGLPSADSGPAFLDTAHGPAATSEAAVHVGGAMQGGGDAGGLIVLFGTFSPAIAGTFSVALTDPAGPTVLGASIAMPAGAASFIVSFDDFLPSRGDIDWI